MRKVTQNTVNAFIAGKPYTEGNTAVTTNAHGAVCMTLHGNLIAIRYPDGDKETEISHAGWPTPTTKERLNGLLQSINGKGIYQKKGVWYIDGEAWDGDWLKIA